MSGWPTSATPLQTNETDAPTNDSGPQMHGTATRTAETDWPTPATQPLTTATRPHSATAPGWSNFGNGSAR